ncbi:hypothetical protein XA68_13028 [Ophiocordyceps unilateralis]|uniref:Uncharacterized protein n=1 Tax=Ophiocordyceps unilateralis TaxID=268505 RepID=A0A2A9PBZ9_OPHUN|nr:hypothetical protein XA68_13028 [Ophiocordyceps unilateralis]
MTVGNLELDSYLDIPIRRQHAAGTPSPRPLNENVIYCPTRLLNLLLSSSQVRIVRAIDVQIRHGHQHVVHRVVWRVPALISRHHIIGSMPVIHGLCHPGQKRWVNIELEYNCQPVTVRPGPSLQLPLSADVNRMLRSISVAAFGLAWKGSLVGFDAISVVLRLLYRLGGVLVQRKGQPVPRLFLLSQLLELGLDLVCLHLPGIATDPGHELLVVLVLLGQELLLDEYDDMLPVKKKGVQWSLDFAVVAHLILARLAVDMCKDVEYLGVARFFDVLAQRLLKLYGLVQQPRFQPASRRLAPFLDSTELSTARISGAASPGDGRTVANCGEIFPICRQERRRLWCKWYMSLATASALCLISKTSWLT